MRIAPSLPRCFIAAFLLLFLASAVEAQAPVGTWTSHTALRDVKGLARSDSALWVATTGGVYRYGIQTEEIRRFTVTEGLHDVDVRALSYDSTESAVWVGYQDGVIDRIDVATGSVSSFQDIARSDEPQKNIYQLRVRGGALYAATAFGVVVFDVQEEVVRDSYTRLGSLSASSNVYDIAFAATPSGDPGLWIATEGGVAYASLQAPNLKDPAAWTIEPMVASSDKLVARSIASFEGALYVGMDLDLGPEENYNGDALGLYRRLAESYERVSPINTEVKALFASKQRLYGAGRWRAFEVNAARQARWFQDGDVPRRPSSIVANASGRLWIGDEEGVVEAQRPSTSGDLLQVEMVIRPDGPYENNISDLHADESGRLIAGGSAGQRTGFYLLGSDGWQNYTKPEYEALPNTSVAFERVYGQRDGHIWAGSYGGGVAMVAPDGEVSLFNEHDSTLGGIPNNASYIVVGGVDVDHAGRLWVTTKRNRNRNHALHVRTPEGEWKALPNRLGPGRTYDRLFIDSYGQKWISTARYDKLRIIDGLAVLDTKNTPSNPDDDVHQLFDQEGENGTGLPSLFVTGITEDRDGVIWVSTQNGVARLLNTGLVAEDPNAQFVWPQRANYEAGESPYLLHGLAVNDIAVDPSNRLWAATERGVYHVEQAEQGYRILRHFTIANAPLPSNSVQSVAVNDQTGIVYFATSRGLVGFQNEAVRPVEQKQDLVVYPNPVMLEEDADPDIYIKGLVEETEVRILTPDGRTVARLEGRGGRVRWDGHDLQDQLVPSGIYLIVAVGENGEGAAYGKVAILR